MLDWDSFHPELTLNSSLNLHGNYLWVSASLTSSKQALRLLYISCLIQNVQTNWPAVLCLNLIHVKQTLDNIYFKSLPRRISQSPVPQVPHSQESDREIPLNVIDWAVRQSAPARRPYLCRVSPQYQALLLVLKLQTAFL